MHKRYFLESPLIGALGRNAKIGKVVNSQITFFTLSYQPSVLVSSYGFTFLLSLHPTLLSILHSHAWQ